MNFKGAININGNRVFNNVFLLDGVDNVSYSSSYRGENVQVIQPSIEALEEFKIQTNAYSAEFGRSSGGVINAAIRSGQMRFAEVSTNSSETMRSMPIISFQMPLERPNPFCSEISSALRLEGRFRRTRCSGSRTMKDCEDERASRRRASLPSAQAKGGRLQYTGVRSVCRLRKPQFGRNAIGQWVIPQDRWDPVAAKIVALIPDPNVPGTNIYASTPVTRTRADQFDVRMDYQMSHDTRLFGRYSFADSDVFRPAPLPGLAEGSYSDAFGSNDNRSQGIAVGLTHVFSSSFVGDFRFGWTRGNYFTSPPNAGIDGPAAGRFEECSQRSRNRWRPSEDRSAGLRCHRTQHIDAAVPDPADLESAADVLAAGKSALPEVRIRVPEDRKRRSMI